MILCHPFTLHCYSKKFTRNTQQYKTTQTKKGKFTPGGGRKENSALFGNECLRSNRGQPYWGHWARLNAHTLCTGEALGLYWGCFSPLVLTLTVTVFVSMLLLFQAMAHYLIREVFFILFFIFVVFICFGARSHVLFINLKLEGGVQFLLLSSAFINYFGDCLATAQLTVTCTPTNFVSIQGRISR